MRFLVLTGLTIEYEHDGANKVQTADRFLCRELEGQGNCLIFNDFEVLSLFPHLTNGGGI